MDPAVYAQRIDSAATDILADPEIWYTTIGPLAGLFTHQVSVDIHNNLKARGIPEADIPRMGGW